MQCVRPEDSSSDSDCSSDQYQDVPLRLVTRQECDEVDESSSSSPDDERLSLPSPPAIPVRGFPSLCDQLTLRARSHSPSHQNSQVDQDTNNLFGGDHSSVIRKGIANGKSGLECRPPLPLTTCATRRNQTPEQ